MRSCNGVFYRAGVALGTERISEAARGFGFGERTGCGLPGERAGKVPDEGPSPLVAIGQAGVAVTPLQVVRMMAAVANGGRLVAPRIFAHGADGAGATVAEPAPLVPVPPEALAEIREALADVVSKRAGTAHGRGLDRTRAAGKTGTADVIRARRAEERPNGETGAIRVNAVWFAGFAPRDDPAVAIVVVVEDVVDGTHAGDVAVPIAAEILDATARALPEAFAEARG